MTEDTLEATKAAILAKRDELVRERARIAKERVALDMRDRQIDRDLADCVAAGRVFGISVEIPLNADDREHMRNLFAQGSLLTHAPRVVVEGPLTTHRRAQQEAAISEFVEMASAGLIKMPKVKDVVLDRLKAAGSEGVKASAIKAYIAETYGQQLHEKTVGMTLYRLAKDRLVKREGLIWFFDPQVAETKNPGVSPPGSN